MAVAVDMVAERLHKLEDYLNKLDKQVLWFLIIIRFEITYRKKGS